MPAVGRPRRPRDVPRPDDRVRVPAVGRDGVEVGARERLPLTGEGDPAPVGRPARVLREHPSSQGEQALRTGVDVDHDQPVLAHEDDPLPARGPAVEPPVVLRRVDALERKPAVDGAVRPNDPEIGARGVDAHGLAAQREVGDPPAVRRPARLDQRAGEAQPPHEPPAGRQLDEARARRGDDAPAVRPPGRLALVPRGAGQPHAARSISADGEEVRLVVDRALEDDPAACRGPLRRPRAAESARRSTASRTRMTRR